MTDVTEQRWVYGVVPRVASLHELERRADRLPPVWLLELGALAAIVGDAVPIIVETTVGADWAGSPLTAPTSAGRKEDA